VPQFCEALQRLERVDRGVLLATGQDPPDHGVDRVGLGGKEITELD
jgi:hypothetical protein